MLVESGSGRILGAHLVGKGCEEVIHLFALAIQCDKVRFGSITFLAAGERIRLKGKYEYEGRLVFEFDDRAQRNSGGAQGCSHEWWHDFNEKKKNEQLRAHAHMKMREIGEVFGISPSRTSRIVQSGLDKVKVELQRRGYNPQVD